MIERLVVVAVPLIVVPPTTCRVEDGETVPIPKRLFVLSQIKLLLWSIVPLALPVPKIIAPETIVVDELSGAKTVQFVSPGAQVGFRISPGA